MKTPSKSSEKFIAKQKKIKEIISLLQNHGPLRASEIISLLENITITAVNRYLSELTLSGHVRKVQAQGAPKNILAYQFHSEYGAKTDIVSLALSHPMHRLTLSLVKIRSPNSDRPNDSINANIKAEPLISPDK